MPASYLFDAAALSELEGREDSAELWSQVNKIADEGRFFYTDASFDELGKLNKIVQQHLKNYPNSRIPSGQDGLVTGHQCIESYEAGAPWLGSIASETIWCLAVAINKGLVVVSQQAANRPDRLPRLCVSQGVPSMTLSEFLEVES